MYKLIQITFKRQPSKLTTNSYGLQLCFFDLPDLTDMKIACSAQCSLKQANYMHNFRCSGHTTSVEAVCTVHVEKIHFFVNSKFQLSRVRSSAWLVKCVNSNAQDSGNDI